MNAETDSSARQSLRAMGPAVFWGSLVSLVLSLIVSTTVDGSSASRLIVTPYAEVHWLAKVFFSVIVIRIYVGIVFLSNDSSFLDVVKAMTTGQRRWLFVTQTGLIVVANMSTSLISIFDPAGYAIAGAMVVVAFAIFWIILGRPLLKDDKDWRTNWYIFFADLFAVAFLVNLWFDLGAAAMFWTLFAFSALFFIEYVATYRESWASYLKATAQWIENPLLLDQAEGPRTD